MTIAVSVGGGAAMSLQSYSIGRHGEDIASSFLSKKGYEIVERNFHSQQGEIDIIAREGRFLVFVEVKNYTFRSIGSPLSAVNRAKKQSMIHAARTYLMKNNIRDMYCRFDVLAIYNYETYNLIKDAFHVS
jgi:putative endonuclease